MQPPKIFGRGLRRPESVLALDRQRVFVSDKVYGVARVGADTSASVPLAGSDPDFLANGIDVLAADGSFLIANLGVRGGLWRLIGHGRLMPACGKRAFPDGPLGFTSAGPSGERWLVFPTRQSPRSAAYKRSVSDGRIGVIKPDGSLAICAERLCFPNEARVDPSGRWLYVTETFARRISRFEIGPEFALRGRATVHEFGAATYPDGFCFDTSGSCWVAGIATNGLLEVTYEGMEILHYQDCDAGCVDSAEQAFQAGAFGSDQILAASMFSFGNPTSVAFTPDNRDHLVVGSLTSQHLWSFKCSEPGWPVSSWTIGPTVLD